MDDHLILLVVFSFFVSVVFAVLMREEPKAQLRFGALVFAGFVVAAFAIGWLLYPFPV